MAQAPTILAADDDEEWRGLIAFALQKAGYRVLSAPDGKSVLLLAQEHRPACFVLDHDLGDMTGAQLCRELKSMPRFKSVPIVIMTAHADVLPGLIAGVPPEHFVVKTGSLDELLTVLGDLVPLPAA